MLALVIDDSRAMRRMLGRFLTDLGFEVAEAGDGREALDRLREIERPDLMLVDWNMPVMNGLEFVQEVRAKAEYADSRIMMVTTETGIDRVGDALEAGADEYLMKPFTQDALNEKLEILELGTGGSSKASDEPPKPKLRVLVVDDSAVVRRVVCSALEEEPDIETETAENGKVALEKVDSWAPDVVVLDIEMPVLDGLATLQEIRKFWLRLPVIMFSTLTERGAAVTLQAFAEGASGYVTKPQGASGLKESMTELRVALAEQIRALCRQGTSTPQPTPSAPTEQPTPRSDSPIDAVVIASSTGGPVALAEVVPNLPEDLPVPVLVVQHMPQLFTKLLANSLDQKSPMQVSEGEAGAAVEPGRVWLAPGGFHMEVERDGDAVRLVTHDGPMEQSVRPAADVLLRSVVEVYGGRVLVVVLTGMGRDGLAGCEAVAAAGGRIVVQDEASSVVWGMPGFVARANLAEAVLPLHRIAEAVVERLKIAATSQSAS